MRIYIFLNLDGSEDHWKQMIYIYPHIKTIQLPDMSWPLNVYVGNHFSNAIGTVEIQIYVFPSYLLHLLYTYIGLFDCITKESVYADLQFRTAE